MKKLIIAVDGFSSCGKSTMAKTLAKRLNYTYVDSGAMYRAASLFCMQNGLIHDGLLDVEGLRLRLDEVVVSFRNNAEGMSQTYLNGVNVEREIRTMEVSNLVSMVSAVGFVREKMVELQRKAGAEGGIVMDGRDIGTVVFPEADLKIFVTADATIRAQRRYDELVEKGQPEDFDAILENIEKRDLLDQTRLVSPLRRASDAIEMDNGLFNLEQQDAWLLEHVNKKLHGNN
ncbi:MAG: (d)CMP kinase [Bacteroidia bacterium]|nr:(d)CMP kinase [Bacteroidia bacterium]